jgi:hypothetical protein
MKLALFLKKLISLRPQTHQDAHQEIADCMSQIARPNITVESALQ